MQGRTMLDRRQVFSPTDFLRPHRNHIARLGETGNSVVLTVKGMASLIIQDAESYQQLIDRLERAEANRENK